MKYVIAIIIGVLAVVAAGCAGHFDEPQTYEKPAEIRAADAIVTVTDTFSIVDEIVAANIADIFRGKMTISRSLTEKYVEPIKNSDNEIVAYVVNYDDNDGFVVISANKEAYPIIAYGDTGKIDETLLNGTFAKEWIIHMASMKGGKNQAASLEIARSWNRLTATNRLYSTINRSVNDDVSTTTNAAIAKWNQQGYQVVSIENADPSQYPSAISQKISEMKGSLSYNTPSFVLSRESQVNRNVSPLIKTKWNSAYPYTAALPNPQTNSIPATGLAIARIMYYHDYPKTLNLSSLPLSITTATANDPLPQVLLQVSRMCGYREFYDDESSISKASQGLETGGYKFSNKLFGTYSMYDQLRNYGPVYMQHDKSSGLPKYNIAWLCDGFSVTEYTNEYKIVQYTGDFSDIDPTATFGTLKEETLYSVSPSAYHMEWNGMELLL